LGGPPNYNKKKKCQGGADGGDEGEPFRKKQNRRKTRSDSKYRRKMTDAKKSCREQRKGKTENCVLRMKTAKKLYEGSIEVKKKARRGEIAAGGAENVWRTRELGRIRSGEVGGAARQSAGRLKLHTKGGTLSKLD